MGATKPRDRVADQVTVDGFGHLDERDDPAQLDERQAVFLRGADQVGRQLRQTFAGLDSQRRHTPGGQFGDVATPAGSRRRAQRDSSGEQQLTAAQQRAAAVVQDAEQQVAQLHHDADDYAIHSLQNLGEHLEHMLTEVRNGIAVLKPDSGSNE